MAFEFLPFLSAVFGWIYFLCWSGSFYPQPLLNFTRKTTAGTTVDFPLINCLGTLQAPQELWRNATGWLIRDLQAFWHTSSLTPASTILPSSAPSTPHATMALPRPSPSTISPSPLTPFSSPASQPASIFQVSGGSPLPRAPSPAASSRASHLVASRALSSSHSSSPGPLATVTRGRAGVLSMWCMPSLTSSWLSR